MDATGSMGSYIASATKNIETICDNVSEESSLVPNSLIMTDIAIDPFSSSDYSIRAAFRSRSIACWSFGLPRSPSTRPEAVTAALYAVTEMVSDGVCRQFGRPPDSLTTLTYRNGGREQQEWQSSLLMHLLMASEK
jgi:hypothetical protein